MPYNCGVRRPSRHHLSLSKMPTFLAFPRKFEGRYQVGIQELRPNSEGQLRYITIAIETFDTIEQANKFSARFTGEPCL